MVTVTCDDETSLNDVSRIKEALAIWTAMPDRLDEPYYDEADDLPTRHLKQQQAAQRARRQQQLHTKVHQSLEDETASSVSSGAEVQETAL